VRLVVSVIIDDRMYRWFESFFINFQAKVVVLAWWS